MWMCVGGLWGFVVSRMMLLCVGGGGIVSCGLVSVGCVVSVGVVLGRIEWFDNSL